MVSSIDNSPELDNGVPSLGFSSFEPKHSQRDVAFLERPFTDTIIAAASYVSPGQRPRAGVGSNILSDTKIPPTFSANRELTNTSHWINVADLEFAASAENATLYANTGPFHAEESSNNAPSIASDTPLRQRFDALAMETQQLIDGLPEITAPQQTNVPQLMEPFTSQAVGVLAKLQNFRLDTVKHFRAKTPAENPLENDIKALENRVIERIFVAPYQPSSPFTVYSDLNNVISQNNLIHYSNSAQDQPEIRADNRAEVLRIGQLLGTLRLTAGQIQVFINASTSWNAPLNPDVFPVLGDNQSIRLEFHDIHGLRGFGGNTAAGERGSQSIMARATNGHVIYNLLRRHSADENTPAHMAEKVLRRMRPEYEYANQKWPETLRKIIDDNHNDPTAILNTLRNFGYFVGSGGQQVADLLLSARGENDAFRSRAYAAMITPLTLEYRRAYTFDIDSLTEQLNRAFWGISNTLANIDNNDTITRRYSGPVDLTDLWSETPIDFKSIYHDWNKQDAYGVKLSGDQVTQMLEDLDWKEPSYEETVALMKQYGFDVQNSADKNDIDDDSEQPPPTPMDTGGSPRPGGSPPSGLPGESVAESQQDEGATATAKSGSPAEHSESEGGNEKSVQRPPLQIFLGDTSKKRHLFDHISIPIVNVFPASMPPANTLKQENVNLRLQLKADQFYAMKNMEGGQDVSPSDAGIRLGGKNNDYLIIEDPTSVLAAQAFSLLQFGHHPGGLGNNVNETGVAISLPEDGVSPEFAAAYEEANRTASKELFGAGIALAAAAVLNALTTAIHVKQQVTPSTRLQFESVHTTGKPAVDAAPANINATTTPAATRKQPVKPVPGTADVTFTLDRFTSQDIINGNIKLPNLIDQTLPQRQIGL